MSEAKEINTLLNKIILKDATAFDFKNFLKQELFEKNYYLDQDNNSFFDILYRYTRNENGDPIDNGLRAWHMISEELAEKYKYNEQVLDELLTFSKTLLEMIKEIAILQDKLTNTTYSKKLFKQLIIKYHISQINKQSIKISKYFYEYVEFLKELDYKII